jgi:SulP family sulfate permease
LEYLEQAELEAGYCLLREGEDSDGLYFIESGQLIAQISIEGKPADEYVEKHSASSKVIRLRAMGPGTVVGEVGMYLDTPRTASVIARKNSVVYRLSGDALERMQKQDPELASEFLQYIVRLLAERLADNNRTIQVLSD